MLKLPPQCHDMPSAMNRLFTAACLLLLCLSAPVNAKTAADCEPIKNPMEFNRCLASLSPVRGSPEARRRGRRPPEGAAVPRQSGASIRTASAKPAKVKLPEGALQMVNGRVRLSLTPR